MAADIATLGLAIDSTQVDRADQGLDKLANTGAKAEASTKKVTSASAELNNILRQLLGAVQSNTEAQGATATASMAVANAQDRVVAASLSMSGAMSNAAKSATEMANAENKAAVANDNAGRAAAAADAHVRAFADEQKRAAAEAANLTSRANQLKASVDPMAYAIDKVNAELAEAKQLLAAGAISAGDYAQAQSTLTARAEAFAAKQAVMNARLTEGAGAARLTGTEALNLSRQFADVGVSAAMGMNPLMILIQQGPQIADIMQTSGLSVKDVVIEFLKLVGIVRVVEAANDNLIEGAENAAAANTKQALANEAVAASAAKAAAATSRQTAAYVSQNGAVATTAVVTGEVIENMDGLGEAGARGLGRVRLAAGPAAVALAAIAVVAGTAAIGLKMMANEVNEDVEAMNASLGLTEKQLKKLKDDGVDMSVTIGDSWEGFKATVGDILYETFEPQIKWLKETWEDAYNGAVDGAVWMIKRIVGDMVGGTYAIIAAFKVIPGAVADIGVQAANFMIMITERMINAVIAKVNTLTKLVNDAGEFLGVGPVFGEIGNVSLGQMDNPNAGKARGAMGEIGAAYTEGRGVGEASVDSFGDRWKSNTVDAHAERLRAGAGDPGKETGSKSRSGGQSERDKLIKEVEEFTKSLQKETAEIGKNSMELKQMAADQMAAKAAAAGLTDQALEVTKAMDAWRLATEQQALKDLKRDLKDQNEELEFENKLLGMNARERAVAIAQREIDMKLRALERDGIKLSVEDIQKETDAILANAAAKGQRQLDVDNARAYADEMGRLHDNVRNATSSLGELFGSAGRGFAEMIDVVTRYRDTQLDAETRVAEARNRFGAESAEAKKEEQRATEEMARAEMDYYGDMLGAAKRFFKEKSTGWKVLEAAEKAYRAYQAISAIIEMINVTKSIILDNTKTASSVANSGIRASADGVAAIAKAIASLPFPLNLVAGAATAAALVAFGVKLFGGGKGGGASATAEAEAKQPTYTGATDEYGAPTSSYSVLKPGQTRASNDNSTYAPGLSAGSANGGGNNITIGGTSITIEGNVDSDVMADLQEVLDRNKRDTVQEARQAVAEDMQAASGRQRIGG